MDEINKSNILNDYFNLPGICQILIEIKDSGKVSKPNERDMSLNYCLKNNYISRNGSKYSLTIHGREALSAIKEYKISKGLII